MPIVSAAPEPTGKLPPKEWLEWPETTAIMSALSNRGSEVRFVGGCVRDSLVHLPVSDIDIATPDPPDTVRHLLEAAGIRAIPTGIEHGTVTALVGERKFEVTTLRRDAETDGRRARVVFTDDWIEDAKRRDLTINAMSATRDGDVYDPFDGIADLAHGHIRFIGLADDRIKEDYLRILRFFRFFGAYGRPPIDVDALAACRSNAAHLHELSGERIRDELFKILLVAEPSDVVTKMRGVGVLDQILPEAGGVERLRYVNWFTTRAIQIEGLEPTALRHLAALLETDADGVAAIAERLRLSNAEARLLHALVVPDCGANPDMPEMAVKKALRRCGRDVFQDLALLNWASEMAADPRQPRPRKEAWIKLLERARRWENPHFPLSGRDVMAIGVEEGPEVGSLLESVERWWENNDFRPDRQACLDRLMKEAEELQP